MGRSGRRLDTETETAPTSKEDVINVLMMMMMMRRPTAHVEKKLGGFPSKQPRNLDSMVFELHLGIRYNSKIGRLDQQPCKAKADS